MTPEQKLIEAAVDVCSLYKIRGEYNISDAERELRKAVQPFLPRKPRVGVMSINYRETFTEMAAIELTDAVRTRLGDTAGVERREIFSLVRSMVSFESAEKNTDAIMALIAEGGINYEDKDKPFNPKEITGKSL